MSYRDDSYEYYRRRDEFNREQDRQYDYRREDLELERKQQERDRELGWEAARNNDTFNAIRGLAGPELALRYHELSESGRSNTAALPEPQLEFKELHIYEGGYDGVERSQRLYRSFFPQSTTRYIYFEVSCVSNREYLEHKHQMTARIRKPDRSVIDVEWEAVSESGWADSWHTHGWGWARAGNWEAGVYAVELLIDDRQVGQAFFGIYLDKDNKPAIPPAWKPDLDFKLDSDFARFFAKSSAD
jgi:hypothetical protein